MENESQSLQVNRIQRRALIVGIGGLALCVVGAFLNAGQFFQSYLMAYLFWLGITLGCLGILMLHHLVRGMWGLVIQRFLESGTRLIPLMALLFIPIGLLGLTHLYAWARPEVVANDELLQHKAIYLNIPFFLTRTVIYFLIWMAVMYGLNRWSRERGQTMDMPLIRRLQRLSGGGLVLYGGTVTLASIDWVMSLEPHWYSTIYGVIFLIGQGVSTLAFVIIVAALLANRKPLADLIATRHFHDLGNLLLAFVMLWAYVAFSQFLLIWAGNLPEEIPWYLHRTNGGWKWIGLFLIVFHFAVPFLLLLSRRIKRGIRAISTLAIAMIFIHLVNLFWIVAPAFHQKGFYLHWLDIVAPVGVGGIWIAAFVWQLQKRPLLPLDDPLLEKAFGPEQAKTGILHS